jgi:hypothetical protein
MFDARIEINIYRLFQDLGRNVGPWIGAPIKLSEQQSVLSSDDDALTPPQQNAFETCDLMDGPTFLSVREGTFEERTQAGHKISEARFEYVVPQTLSFSTATLIPVVRTSEATFVGIELRDLPAAQAFSQNSRIATVPAWRLPKTTNHLAEVPEFLRDVMQRDFDLTVQHIWELGGSYFASPGVTPEVVYPYLAEVEATEAQRSTLRFVELQELISKVDLLSDAHLLIAIYRATHAL